MIIMGLDPGISGGISVIETNQNKLPKILYSLKMPVVSMYGKKIVDTKKVYESLESILITVWAWKDIPTRKASRR